MPKINRINNIQTYNCNNSIGHNKMHNHNYDYYDNSLIVVFLLSIILNIKLIITLSKKNNNRQRRRRFRIFNSNNESYTINNVNTQTEPEFLSIIVNPNNEFNIIKE